MADEQGGTFPPKVHVCGASLHMLNYGRLTFWFMFLLAFSNVTIAVPNFRMYFSHLNAGFSVMTVKNEELHC